MPDLKLFLGPMFGGKTTRLLAALERYEYQNKETILFKPNIDSRYSRAGVVTHQGRWRSSVPVSTGEDIYSKSANVDVIAIDELFMVPGAASAALELFKEGKTILISTLQLSYRGTPFKEVKEIMPWATSIEVCPAVCSECDADAYYTRRLTPGKATVEIGGSESYSPRCYEHYQEIKKVSL